MRNKLKNTFVNICVALLILIIGLVIFLCVKTYFMNNDIESLETRFSIISSQKQNDYNSEQGVDGSDQRDLITLTSTSMGIISVGVALFTLFGGFLALINMDQSRELSKTMRNAETLLENQKELVANRFVQDGRLYASWDRPHYARSSYISAIEKGKGTFSALIAKFALISMYADRLSDQGNKFATDKMEGIEKHLKDLIKELKQGEHFDDGIRYLRADSYFTLACIYANCTLSAFNLSEQKKYAEKASKMFQCAIKEDDTNPDIYRNYAAHLFEIHEIKKCKKQIKMAYKCAKEDVLLSDFMNKERLVKLFMAHGKRTEEEAEDIITKIGGNV